MFFSLALLVGIALSPLAMAGQAPSPPPWEVAQLPPEALLAPMEEPPSTNPRVTVLEELAQRAREGGNWQEWAAQHGLLVEGQAVLVELRWALPLTGAQEVALERLGVRPHTHTVPTLMEAWVPARALGELERLAGPVRVEPAKLARPLGHAWPLAGTVRSEGVTESGLDAYHNLGANGHGVLIAVIDVGFEDWAARQSGGDWPPASHLRRFQVSGSTVTDCDVGSCPTYASSLHGAATVEIAYDAAPQARFLTYKVATLGEWYQALLHASDAGLNGWGVADVISVSLRAPLNGVGDGSSCPSIWPAPCGTIAEAATTARSRGSLVVNAAGNGRIQHWGGVYAPSTGNSNLHAWIPGTNRHTNFIGNGSGVPFCIRNGTLLTAELYWDNWTAPVNHDYDLELYKSVEGGGWSLRASSSNPQNGGAGQSPQEYISWWDTTTTASPGCPPNHSVYGYRIRRISAATNRNLQFFGPFDMDVRVPARSYGFPADSPAVVAVGALAVGSPASQEYYSAEGPQLSPGGGLGAPTNPKIDLMSFAQVSTVSYGPGGFAGTSAPTPHTAGVAAVLTQLRNEKPVERGSQPAGIQRALELASLNGDNDLGAPGHDPVFGYGRLRLRECSVAANIQAGWNLVALPCDRRTQNTPAGVFGAALGTFNTDWAMWRWNAATNAYQRILNAHDPLSLGEGYWVYRFTTPAPVSYTGLVADRSEAYPRAVAGGPGLGRPHMIGAPRHFQIPWNQVRFYYGGSEKTFLQAYNDGMVRNHMWRWNRATQSYEVFDGLLGQGVIVPGEGFWIRVYQDLEVRLPAELAGGGPAPEGRLSVGWQGRLLLAGKTAQAHGELGHRLGALDGFDPHDAEHLPAPAALPLRLSFPHPDWKEYAGSYLRDIRAPKKRDEWVMLIEAGEAMAATLTWEMPAWVVADSVLVDEATGKEIPVRTLRDGYPLQLAAGTRQLRWRLGADSTSLPPVRRSP